MTEQHPIIPPPELVEQWYDAIDNLSTSWKQQLATRAAQWGADQELEACCEWLAKYRKPILAADLKYVRRPKPPSLKEQALAALEQVEADFNTGSFGDTIRRALKELPNA